PADGSQVWRRRRGRLPRGRGGRGGRPPAPFRAAEAPPPGPRGGPAPRRGGGGGRRGGFVRGGGGPRGGGVSGGGGGRGGGAEAVPAEVVAAEARSQHLASLAQRCPLERTSARSTTAMARSSSPGFLPATTIRRPPRR